MINALRKTGEITMFKVRARASAVTTCAAVVPETFLFLFHRMCNGLMEILRG